MSAVLIGGPPPQGLLGASVGELNTLVPQLLLDCVARCRHSGPAVLGPLPHELVERVEPVQRLEERERQGAVFRCISLATLDRRGGLRGLESRSASP